MLGECKNTKEDREQKWEGNANEIGRERIKKRVEEISLNIDSTTTNLINKLKKDEEEEKNRNKTPKSKQTTSEQR